MNTLKLSLFSSTPSLPLTAVFSAMLLLSACSSSDSGSIDSVIADTQSQVSDIEVLPESGANNEQEGAATSDVQNSDVSAISNNPDVNSDVNAIADNSETTSDEPPTSPVTDAQSSNTALTPSVPQASFELMQNKTFRISWQATQNAEFYRVLENPDGLSGYSLISDDIIASALTFDHQVALFNRINARYIVQACNASECVDSDSLLVTGSLNNAIGYFKASNTDINDNFGSAVSLSADGNTLAIGAEGEHSAATGINDDETDNSAEVSGAVYVFVRRNGIWQQQAYLKASNAESFDLFGTAVSLSEDGNTLAVGASWEDSSSTGMNGDQTDNSAPFSGAAYIFVRSGDLWQQQAYIKASNSGIEDTFGGSLALSADGFTLAVGAEKERSRATGINGDQTDNLAFDSGAVYVFVRTDDLWQQQAYLKPSNTGFQNGIFFGHSLSLNSDGSTLAVGAISEDVAVSEINGDQNGNLIHSAGAVYVFARRDDLWKQQAFLHASNPGIGDHFGRSLSLSADGQTLAVGADEEASTATGINGDESDNLAYASGAVYVFEHDNALWRQQAYLKASNSDANEFFGRSVSLNADGDTLAVGAVWEASISTGINRSQSNNSAFRSGAVYVFVRSDGLHQQQAYLKASNTDAGDNFGGAIALSADGNTLAVGAHKEDSATNGINNDLADNSAVDSGAVYLY